MPYLSKRALEGLKDYKYKPAGYTPIDAWHQGVWNYITDRLPTWLAPNLITLIGLCALVTAYFITAYHLPDFTGPKPHWLYFLGAFSVFFYLHMDALDGKQARRTKTSSPLGQLFDHGCDALAVHLILVTLITSLQFVHEWRAVSGFLYVFLPFWLAHWEEYHTGVMLYGNGAWGVTEANYAVVLTHVYTFVLGPKGFTFHLFDYIFALTGVGKHLPPTVTHFLSGLQMNEIIMITFGYLGITLTIDQIRRVFRLAGSKQLDHTTLPPAEKGNKTLGKAAAAWHLLQILGTCACGGALLLLPIVPAAHARVLYATFGVAYAMQATRHIMAHMSKEPFVIAVWPLALIFVQLVNCFVEFTDPVFLAYAVNMTIVLGYLHYVISMVGEICEYLGIKALTIKPSMD